MSFNPPSMPICMLFPHLTPLHRPRHQELDRVNAENKERKRKTTRLVVRSAQDLLPPQHLQIGNAPSTAPASFGQQQPTATLTAPSPFASSFAAPVTA